MSKREKRSARRAPRASRARILAPAALAALLAGPGDVAALVDDDPDPSPTDAGLARLTSPDQLRAIAARLRLAAATRAPRQDVASVGAPGQDDRVVLSILLPEILVLLSPIERVEIVAGWATSSSPHLRLAIARALRQGGPTARTPGSLTAIEHLSEDPDPSVRAAVVEAAWMRRSEHPGRLGAVLTRLADDENLFVRETARLALGDA
jgi:HEAT repeat protein